MTPRTLFRFVRQAEYVAIFVALAGVLLEWWGIVWVWVVAAVTMFAINLLLLRMNSELIDGMQRLTEFRAELLSQVTVVCADCHVRTTIAPSQLEIGPPAVISLPRGWQVRDRRPYCPACLLK